MRDHTARKLRAAADKKEKVVIHGLALGREALDDIELEPMEVWSRDAKILVDDDRTIRPPDVRYFRGRVAGVSDSAVFLAVEKGKARGMVLVGEKRFNFGSLEAAGKDAADSALAISEIDPADDVNDPAADWTCKVENTTLSTSTVRKVTTSADTPIRTEAGAVASAAYTLRLAIDTDVELTAAFGGDANAIAAYLANLVGQTSVIFQRDVNTTLLLHHVQIRIASDPWGVGPESGAPHALREFGNFWHVSYPEVQRSAAILLSGKAFNSGIAWTGTLCGEDASCGPNGQYCGNEIYANTWAGAYAFCGTKTSGVTTTVPDPTLTIGGVQYALPNENNYWMLLQFAHELGHLASSPHSHCVALTPAEQTLYGVSRSWVDSCSNETGCNNGSTSFPAEYGTIMSYCDNFFTGSGYRASRFLFGHPDEPSAKMLTYLRNGIDGGTPNGYISLGSSLDPVNEESQPVVCGGGRVAKVLACQDCTYEWSIAGGQINSGTGTNQITYTPAQPAVVISITVTRPNGCAISTTRTVTTQCAALTPPANFAATATSSTMIQLTWTPVQGAAMYEVYRRGIGGGFTILGTTNSATMNDVSAQPEHSYLYRVRALDANNVASNFSTIDLATTVVFTDPDLSEQVTTIKAAHMTELRSCVNAVRALAGRVPVTFTDPTLAGVDVKATHLDELRVYLAEARTDLGLATAPYTDPTVALGIGIRRIHIDELRQNVR